MRVPENAAYEDPVGDNLQPGVGKSRSLSAS